MENFIPKLRFMVVSDLHYQDEHTVQRDYFEKAVGLAYEYAKKSSDHQLLDALFVVGDLANTGTEIQMQAFNESLKKTVRPETDVTLAIARHEFICEGEAAAYEKFRRIFQMEPDVHKKINDFHFISLCTTGSDRFDDAKKAFAHDALQIAVKDDPKKPIFFFQHPHIQDTVYGSMAWSNDDLMPLLMNYPQVVNFSGHSHAPNNDPRSIHQKHFTTVGTGTMFYFEGDEYDKIYGPVPPNKNRQLSNEEGSAQMLIVEVDALGRVKIMPYDVITEQFYPLSWVIEKAWDPSTFIYTDARYRNPEKPYFNPSAAIDITEILADAVTFTFDQATIDKEYVNSYDMTITRVVDDVIVRKVSIWSEYYYMDMPETLTQKIDQLESATEYLLTISANSFWKTASVVPLTIRFTTQS